MFLLMSIAIGQEEKQSCLCQHNHNGSPLFISHHKDFGLLNPAFTWIWISGPFDSGKLPKKLSKFMNGEAVEAGTDMGTCQCCTMIGSLLTPQKTVLPCT